MRKIVFLLILALVIPASPTFAHSGRTDSSGGHNCNVGACAGTYHYHNGGSAPSTPRYNPPAPRKPSIIKKTITEDAAVKFSEKIDYNSHEYDEYFKLIKEGANGINRTSIEITYTDGVETSRNSPVITTLTSATERVAEKGVRIKPEAKLTHLNKTKKKNKYDISGEYLSNSEVVLSVDGKKVKRAKTDKDGKFTFRGVKIKSDKADLIVYKRVKKKENQVSEKTYADLKNQSLKTEYDTLHDM